MFREVGYDDIESFLYDNPGAIERLVEFVEENFSEQFEGYSVKGGYEDGLCPRCHMPIADETEDEDECACGYVFHYDTSKDVEFDISELSPEMCRCLEQAKEEKNEWVLQFIRHAVTNGLVVDYYRGRNFYYGPAVVCDLPSGVLSLTNVECVFDSLGKGFIVYPRKGLKSDLRVRGE